MQEEITADIPAFTDEKHWACLDEVIDNIKESDAIGFELYHELKDLAINYLNGQYTPKEFRRLVNERMKIIDPELIKKEPNHTMSPTHGYILDKLRGKKFLCFETLESYDNSNKKPLERNSEIIKNTGQFLDKYSKETNTFIIFMATGHSRFLRYHLGEENSLDLNKYTKLTCIMFNTIKEGEYNLSYSLKCFD